MRRLYDEEGKVRIFFVLSLPVLERLNIPLLVHVLTTLSKLLIVNDVDVRALLTQLFHPSCVVLQSFYDQLFVYFFLETKGQQSYLLIS